MTPSMTEEELVSLFDYMEALIESKGRAAGLDEFIRVKQLRRDCIDMIAFGESLGEGK